jgi:oligogalacturonide transport system substrate-binding protein
MPAMAARSGPDRRAACLALPALLLAGCGRGPSDALRLSWWGGAARHQATLAAVAAFERRHPGVRVKCEYMGFNGYLERLTTQVAGGAEPDVMQINWAWLAMFSKRGTGFVDLLGLRGLLSLDAYSPEDLASGMVKGRLNALPASYTARVLLWNRSSFARAGLALPRSWDELFALGAPFRRALGAGAFPLDGELYDMLLLAQAWVQQRHGTPYVDPAEPRVAMSDAAALDWVRIYQRLVGEQVATPLPLRASLGGAEKPTEQQPDWVNGRWAGNYTWDSAIPLRASTLRPGQDLALGDFPRLPGAADSGIFGRPALMYAVSRRSRRTEDAARLVDFLLTDPEAARLLGRTRGLPAARGPRELLLAEGRVPPLELQAAQAIDAERRAGRITMPSPLFEHARLQKFMREVFETVAYGKADAPTAARRLVSQGQALLQRIK